MHPILAFSTLLFAFTAYGPSSAQTVSQHRLTLTSNTDVAKQQLFSQAFDFAESEEDWALYNGLIQRVLDMELRDAGLLTRIAKYYLGNRDRNGLMNFFKEVAHRYSCQTAAKVSPCREMRQLWVTNLDSIFFYEESASKFERLRRLLEAKDCSNARAVLKEIQVREGVLKSLLEAELGVAECFADIETQDQVRRLLEGNRLFINDL